MKQLITSLLIGISTMPADDRLPGGGYDQREELCGLSAANFRQMDHGEVIGRVLPVAAPGELALLGAVRLPVTKEAFLDWYRNTENFKQSPLVIEAGRFGHPPSREDLARFRLAPQEVADLPNCRIGDCGIKLTGEELALLQKAMDWSGRGAGEHATSLVRRIFSDSAAGYMDGGEGSLKTMADRKRPADRREQFRLLLESSGCITERFAGLRDRLDRFDGADTEDSFLYWTIERYGFGLKPLLNIVHAQIHHPGAGTIVISARQIRASHYYDGSLAFTVLRDAPGGGSYLIYINRSRIDLLRGFLKGWKRELVERNAPRAIRKEISVIRAKVAAASVPGT